MSARICSVEGCGRPHNCKGFCKPHYERWRKNGDSRSDLPLRNPQGSALSFLETVVLPFVGSECLIWPFTRNKSGHATVKFEGSNQVVARIVCVKLKGPAPTSDHEAAHSCGRGHLGCVNGNHLRWATHAENEADKITHGTSNRGARHGMAKLTEPEIKIIRAIKAPSRQIAAMFGVSQTTISKIKRGEGWSHV